MRTRLAFIALALALPLTAAAGEPAAVSSEIVHRGAPFALKDKPITLDEVAAKPDAFAGKTTMIAGKVASVCQKKGCWLGLKSDKGTVARVTFKDYGFFAPKDCAGQVATVEAEVKVTKLDLAEREHLAKDAGKTVADIPEVELRLVANGLELTPAL
jgi:hypothetical protein